MIPIHIIKFCGEEVERQHDSPKTVVGMCKAWNWMKDMPMADLLTPSSLVQIGAKVKACNIEGYRRVGVTVDGLPTGARADDIERQIMLLFNAAKESQISPAEFYQRFEEIHPFLDGNGRVGALYYNALKNTFTQPVAAPPFIVR